jgi:hypothetical protein
MFRTWLGLGLTALPVLVAGCGNDARPQNVARDAGMEHDAGPTGTQTSLLALSPTHSCALRQAGLYCWGDNFAGQLGTGDTEPSTVPVQALNAGTDIVQLAASTGRTCVRRRTGAVACWGDNALGQFGDGTRQSSLLPVEVVGLENNVSELAIQDGSACALRGKVGSVQCWGASPEDAPDDGSLQPVAIEGVSRVIELRAGVSGTYCGRRADGSVTCWQLQAGKWSAAADVAALAGARAIALTGGDEVCAIAATGEIRCHNLYDDSTVKLGGSEDSVALVGTQLWGCAKNTQGEWHCWNVLPPMLESVGSNAIALPASASPVTSLALGGLRLCALREDDSVACVDANDPSLRLVDVSGLPE